MERFNRFENVAAFPFSEPNEVHQSIIDKLKEFQDSSDDNKAKEALTNWLKQNLPDQVYIKQL